MEPGGYWQAQHSLTQRGGRHEPVRREIYTYLLNGILLTKDAECGYFFT